MIFKRLKAVSDFYLYSNLHIALCAVAMVFTSQILFTYYLRTELYIFVFCGTFFLYNLQRLPSAFANVKIESEFIRHKWNTEHKVFLAVVSAIAGIAAAWSYFQLYHRSQLVALLPAALSFAYAFPFIRLKGRWRKLRDIEATKIFIIALVWGIICTMLPATANDPSGKDWHSAPVLIWFAACSMMIFAITIPFDIRDLYYDGEKLRTIPVILGMKKSIALALSFLLVSDLLVGVLAIYYDKGGWPAFAGYAVWSLFAALLVYKSSPERKEYYFSFWIDGLMLLLPVILLAAGYACFHV